MFPFEIITYLVSNVMGIFSSVWKMKVANHARLEEAKLAALNERAKVAREIREYEDKGFKVTRRFMAISATVAVLILPMLSPFISMFSYLFADFPFPIIPITFGYTAIDPGFWPFVSDTEVTHWIKENTGILMTPWHTNMVSAIWGFYFGSSK